MKKSKLLLKGDCNNIFKQSLFSPDEYKIKLDRPNPTNLSATSLLADQSGF